MKKQIFTLSEAALFMGYSKSHLYKLTHLNRITHYKPNGKNVFFKKGDLEAYLLQKKIEIKSDLEEQAANYLLQNIK